MSPKGYPVCKSAFQSSNCSDCGLEFHHSPRARPSSTPFWNTLRCRAVGPGGLVWRKIAPVKRPQRQTISSHISVKSGKNRVDNTKNLDNLGSTGLFCDSCNVFGGASPVPCILVSYQHYLFKDLLVSRFYSIRNTHFNTTLTLYLIHNIALVCYLFIILH